MAMLTVLLCLLLVQAGCRSVSDHHKNADEVAAGIIAEKQEEALGRTEPFGIIRPTNILRRRLLEQQNLPYSGPWSLGTDKLEKPKHWPKDEYQDDADATLVVSVEDSNTVILTLLQALQVGAQNNSDYQAQKEGIYQVALRLDLNRDAFRNFLTETVDSSVSSDTTGSRAVSGAEQSSVSGLSRVLKSGAAFSTQIAVDLANLFTMGGASSLGLQADASVSVPLLRGSGSHIVTEPLTQAERNVIYAIWRFERYKRVFAVNIATQYLAVLRAVDRVANEKGNYQRAVVSARWSQQRAETGDLDIIQADQAVQNELRARNSWVLAMQAYERSLDEFKILLGLPVDARIELDRAELDKIVDIVSKDIIDLSKFVRDPHEDIPPADAPVEPELPGEQGAGAYEIDRRRASMLALENRLDLQVAIESVFDAQRAVVVAADQLGAELTLFGSASAGGRRSVGSATSRDARVRLDEASYSALLSLDLPIERLAERNNYRNSLIDLESTVRAAQDLEDQVKLDVRNRLRVLQSTRETLQIQARAVQVAQKRVKGAEMSLEEGRAQMRDILEAQDALVSAQNALTAAVIDYRLTELELQRDMGLLKVDEKGLWQEFDPEAIEE
ncbi:MAG: TolC family protein [Sedimentisphaerales bacterium]|nr:TolC family protein [Sedimentisphaerales bacterium]